MLSLRELPRIVVVDNGSTDGTPVALGRRFPSVRCLALSGNPGASGRNAGVAALDTPYAALCDDDTWWQPGSLRLAAILLDGHPRLAAVAGRVLVGPDNRLDPVCREMATSPIQVDTPLPGPALLGFLACAVVVRRSALLEVGGFEKRFFIGGEEELLILDLLAAGWELCYVADLVIHHHPSEASRDPAGRQRVMVRNHLWVACMRYPWPSALKAPADAARAALIDQPSRAALGEAVRGLPWTLRRRRLVSPEVQRRLRQLASV
jgi:GT2 family glycosyltransferase